MEINKAVVVILLIFYFVEMSSSDKKSCFLETEVKAKVHCRAGILECNTVSLKRDFPHLFNQSFNSGVPEGTTVTPFCETKDGENASYPGLEYRFSPPGHIGVTSIRGFEVRLEGGPPSLSDFKCTIIELEDNLTLEHTDVTFSSRFYPVARKMTYVVVFRSLPRKDETYTDTDHIESKPCDTQKTSADWKPSFCNISYDSASETLNGVFEAPPAKFQFDQFRVTVIDLEKFKHTHSNVNQNEFSVTGIKPGEYEIHIEPYNLFHGSEKLCKCRNSDGRCDSCTEFIIKYDATFTDIPSAPLRTEEKNTISTVLIPMFCITAAIGAFLVVIFLRRHGKFCVHRAMVGANPENKVTIEIVYDHGSLYQRQIADKLKSILSCIFSDNIRLDLKASKVTGDRNKMKLKIYITEPGTSRNEIQNLSKLLQDEVKPIQGTGEDSQHENLLMKYILVSFDTIEYEQLIDCKITHFKLMFELRKMLIHVNSFTHLSQENINKGTESAEYKAVFKELEGIVNHLKQESNDTKLFVELPCAGTRCHADTLNASQCLSNTNSELDSGVRSGDEFESLNSSEETMSGTTPNYGRNENWISCITQECKSNSRYPYNNMAYEKNSGAFINQKTTTQPAIGEKYPVLYAPRCPSEIQFIAPELSEYSEYGEDIFFDEAYKNPPSELTYQMLNYLHGSHNCVPNSVAYHKMTSGEKTQRSAYAQDKGGHKEDYKNSRQNQSSMESLMDQMACVNARYENSIENESMREDIINGTQKDGPKA